MKNTKIANTFRTNTVRLDKSYLIIINRLCWHRRVGVTYRHEKYDLKLKHDTQIKI